MPIQWRCITINNLWTYIAFIFREVCTGLFAHIFSGWHPDTGASDTSFTDWGRGKMAAFFHTTYSNTFSWMKVYEFRSRFHYFSFLKGPINNILALVQMMAWRRAGDKPLSESMLVCLLTHICVTRPQWVNASDVILDGKVANLANIKTQQSANWRPQQQIQVYPYTRNPQPKVLIFMLDGVL